MMFYCRPVVYLCVVSSQGYLLWCLDEREEVEVRRSGGGGGGSPGYQLCINIRPPLIKKSFPVSRVGKRKASREVGNLFFFLI